MTITAREDWNEDTYTQVWNIRESLLDFFLGFGNGIWVEIRIVAETEDGLEAMQNLLRAGGYRPGAQPLPETTLFQSDDECWAGIVFLAPVKGGQGDHQNLT